MKQLLSILFLLSHTLFLLPNTLLSNNPLSNDLVEFIAEGHVSVIVEQETETWYGTLENGVCRWDKNSEAVTCYTTDNSALTSNEIKDLFLDANGDYWASTLESVFRFTDDSWTLMNDSISGLFAQTSNGDLYVLGSYNLSTFDGTDWTDFDMTQVIINHCCAVNDAIQVDANDHLWIAHHDFYQYATLRFDGTNWTVYASSDFAGPIGLYEAVEVIPLESWGDNNTLFVDNDNAIWSGNSVGLQLYQNNEWSSVYNFGNFFGVPLVTISDGEDTLRGIPNSITQDLNGWIWMTTAENFNEMAYFDGGEWQVMEGLFTDTTKIEDFEASQFDENILYVGTSEGLAVIRRDVLIASEDDFSVNVGFRLFLEGNYLGDGTMSTILQEQNLIELSQPYDAAPYLYDGTETVAVLPLGLVDWVLVEARSGEPSTTSERNTVTIETRAAFLMADGTIVGLDGSPGITFDYLLPDQSYHFAIRHRNHLDILTSVPIDPTATPLYDFTTESSQALGVNQLKESDDGSFVMHGGDYNHDGVIQVSDYDQWSFEPAIVGIYSPVDGNLDGVVQTTDYDVWFDNKAKLGVGEIGF